MGAPSIEGKPRRALVLSGGSVGAINAAYLAQTPLGQPREAAAKLRALWDTVSTDKVHRGWFPFGKVAAFFKTSVYDSQPLQKWIRAGLDVGAVRGSGRRLRIVSASLGTGQSFVVCAQPPGPS